MPGAGGLNLHSVVRHPSDLDQLWVGMSAVGVFHTADGGKSWNRGGLDSNEVISSVTSATPGTFVAAAARGNIYISKNGGKTWAEMEEIDQVWDLVAPWMGPEQAEHFREILLAWKNELMEEVDRTVHHMQDEAANFPDPNDRATQESEFGLELRTRDRERKLLRKIDSAIARIDDGSYGFINDNLVELDAETGSACLAALHRARIWNA